VSDSKADRLKAQFGSRLAEAAMIRSVPAQDSIPMATVVDRFAGVKRSRNAGEIEVAKILTDPQVREAMDAEDLERLTASVRARGILQPVRVRWDEVRTSWVCVAGHRRLEAAKRAGLERVPAVLVEGEMAPSEILIDQLTENLIRADLSPMETAKGYRALMDRTGWSAKDVATHIGVSEAAVSRSLALLKLPEPIAAAVDAGSLSARAGAELARVDDPEDQIRLAEEAVQVKMTPEQVAQRVRVGGKAKASPRKLETTYRASNGVRFLVTTQKKHTNADVAAALREIAAKLEAVAGGGVAAA
jgi:ParB family chromosome partitioning protein